MAKNSRLHALILAAGYGRRLAPLTDSVPKPLLPVGGVPLLARIIEDVLALGLEQYEIVINTHHLAEQIQEFISNNYPGIGISHEPEIRGTGGAIIAAASRLGFGPLLIHNGDVYSQAKLSTFIAQAGVAKYAAAMLLRHDEKAQSYGQINRSKSGLIVDIADRLGRPGWSDEKLMFTGIHYLSQKAVGEVKECHFCSVIDNFYIPALFRGEAILGVVSEAYWNDIGTPERLAEVQNYLASKKE